MTNREWLESLTDEKLAEVLMGSFQVFLRVLRETGGTDEHSHVKWLKDTHETKMYAPPHASE